MASDPAGAEAVRLGREPIDPAWLLAAVADPAAGGNVLFLGTARGITAGVVTSLLTYDAHEPLARATLEQLRRQALARFGLVACAVWHRLGAVTPGATSVAVAASAPHRREAFAAAEWLMERIKAEVPIWKCEEGEGGRREWLHPAEATPRAEAEP
jgi:molybdopterin synthase catalytic subunit